LATSTMIDDYLAYLQVERCTSAHAFDTYRRDRAATANRSRIAAGRRSGRGHRDMACSGAVRDRAGMRPYGWRS